MTIRTCPVCAVEQDADDLAFQHHINSHFSNDEAPAENRAGSSSPRKRRLSTYKDRDELDRPVGRSWSKLHEDDSCGEDDDASCPLCAFPFKGTKASEREKHVNTCMDTMTEGDDTPPPPTITHRPSRDFDPSRPSIATTALDTGQRPEPTFHFSDQLIQQSRAAGSDTAPSAEDWDGPAKPGGSSGWSGRADKRDRWWSPTEGRTDDAPENFSPGLVPVLQQLLESSCHKASTKSAVLGRDVVAINGVLRFDLSWGCGYRNALMAISSLVMYFPPLAEIFSRENNGADPGVRRLQGWLDEAWSNGYDPEGRAHFGGKVSGGSRWIGTGDLYALFSYKGVQCELYDFPKPKGPGSRPAHRALTEWIKLYFDEGVLRPTIVQSGASGTASTAFDLMMRTNAQDRGSAVRRADRYPVILQHNGHSRTVVGYEETSGGNVTLLMLDPGKKVPAGLREAGLRHAASSRHALRPTTKPAAICKKGSHETMPFSRPYTDGNSAQTEWRDELSLTQQDMPTQSDPSPGAQRLVGGTAVELDEDDIMDDKGWVRKRINKLSHRKLAGVSALGQPRTAGGTAHKSKTADAAGATATKGLAYFRVNLSALGHHAEYQVLAFTGDEPLSGAERSKRKYLTSTIIR